MNNSHQFEQASWLAGPLGSLSLIVVKKIHEQRWRPVLRSHMLRVTILGDAILKTTILYQQMSILKNFLTESNLESVEENKFSIISISLSVSVRLAFARSLTGARNLAARLLPAVFHSAKHHRRSVIQQASHRCSATILIQAAQLPSRIQGVRSYDDSGLRSVLDCGPFLTLGLLSPVVHQRLQKRWRIHTWRATPKLVNQHNTSVSCVTETHATEKQRKPQKRNKTKQCKIKTSRKQATRAGQDSKRVGVGIISALSKITGRFWEKRIRAQK